MVDRLRRSARLLSTVGVALVVVAAFLPWESFLDAADVTHTRGGWDGAADGFTGVLFALGMLIAVRAQGVQSSRIRAVQLLPAILGLACLFIALDGLQASRAHLDGIVQQGSSGGLEPGIWLFVLGALLAASGGLLASLVVARTNPPLREINPEPLFDREFVGLVVATVAGFLVGLYTGVQAAQRYAGEGGAGAASVTIFAGFVGAFVCSGLAAFGWQRLGPRGRARRRH